MREIKKHNNVLLIRGKARAAWKPSTAARGPIHGVELVENYFDTSFANIGQSTCNQRPYSSIRSVKAGILSERR
jgi:hypothetical protein